MVPANLPFPEPGRLGHFPRSLSFVQNGIRCPGCSLSSPPFGGEGGQPFEHLVAIRLQRSGRITESGKAERKLSGLCWPFPL
jgi:hypothetical protein